MSTWIRVAQCGHYVPGRSTLSPVESCTRCTHKEAEDPPAASAADTPVPQTRLAKCGHAVAWHRGRPRNMCSTCVTSRAVAPKPARPRRSKDCEQCGTTFHPAYRLQRFCGVACSNRKYPPTCTVPGCPRPHRAKGQCSWHYKEQRYPDQVRRFPDDPEAKRKRDLIRAKRRRAAERAVEAENVDRDVVGDRDGWRCGICHRKVDRRKQYPHPMSPSLDHVIPLSHGPHTYANVRIAHLRCNVARGNRGGGEQLLLVG